MSERPSKEYEAFIEEIKEKVRSSQYEAMKKVNRELIALYWEIGRLILERQDEHGWGDGVVEQLSKELREAFPNVQGFSARNLWNMRNLYLHYKDNENLQPLVAEISWSHNLVILQRCSNDQEREFYLRMARRYGWTKNVLVHQLEGKAYERYLSGQTNFDEALPQEYREQAKLAVKDGYNFGFLEMGEEHGEKELERSLLRNIQGFLLEMDGELCFIGNQYRMEVGGEEYFIDLLLYHRRLRCLVAVELKTEKFRPADTGQLQFYLTALNEQEKLEDENPAIGIIICKEKDRTSVDYALKGTGSPMGVADYRIHDSLPEEMKEHLPSSEEIVRRLAELTDDREGDDGTEGE